MRVENVILTADIKPKVILNNIDKVNIFHLLVYILNTLVNLAVTHRRILFNQLYVIIVIYVILWLYCYDYKYYTEILCCFLCWTVRTFRYYNEQTFSTALSRFY